ncbi:MAG TPA: VTT domain-containing protein [Opitutaceae bacterium]|jgi:membrane protein DedA with SNARE-associated domain|nr:VTT domain-containing protein [Opitutaceae bacterium]
MTPIDFIHSYGYLALAAGTFCEGEFSMLAGGALAAAGWLDFAGVVGAGMAGIVASDLAYFFLGRYLGHRAGRYLPNLFSQLPRAFALVEEHRENLALYFQFFSEQTAITPLAFGILRLPAWRFASLDLVGATLWSVLYGLIGLALGGAAVRVAHAFILWLVAAVATAVVLFLVLRVSRALQHTRQHNKPWSAPASASLSGTGSSV